MARTRIDRPSPKKKAKATPPSRGSAHRVAFSYFRSTEPHAAPLPRRIDSS
ncbi:hypothetical protein C7S16_5663 [Burkholderia thailandensis]|uniref:Uncharacterized protein n=1 Tax=Burkholderia thailandensis TaxID=57975 RepID=A0AAW9CN32_BURTH|nr:hypothetical protein [Burkholderia thailandensis]MDW9250981.1 hypothetical protein [Burkholderia thailandensis]